MSSTLRDAGMIFEAMHRPSLALTPQDSRTGRGVSDVNLSEHREYTTASLHPTLGCTHLQRGSAGDPPPMCSMLISWLQSTLHGMLDLHCEDVEPPSRCSHMTLQPSSWLIWSCCRP